MVRNVNFIFLMATKEKLELLKRDCFWRTETKAFFNNRIFFT